jgi:hypothetical protein
LNGKNLTIYSQNQTIISEIELKIDSTQIQAMNFGVDNSLFLIDNNSTITVFTTQLNCSGDYTYQKGYCLCERNFVDQKNGTCACLWPFTLNESNCECQRNFVDQKDGTCACLWPFTLNGKDCECSKNFIEETDGTCACL